MKFQPKTEDELSQVLPKGTYEAEVFRAEEKQSKKGNDMLVLGLRVFGPGDKTVLVTDYITESVAHKLRHFCESCELLDRYESGELEATECLGQSCTVKLKVEEDETGQYPPKNVVGDYVVKKKAPLKMATASAAAKKAGAFPDTNAQPVGAADDDIPFSFVPFIAAALACGGLLA